ncbi:hypothetical protein GGR50DRAFT_206902 [Xylaria sp. CBS 124048]|nr:hypothetical protein GGR50DRAFT_206902 [Xylaria sp. CBS 124048]
MASRNSSPRSVADATRFTPSTPHASSRIPQKTPQKTPSLNNTAAGTPSTPNASAQQAQQAQATSSGKGGATIPQESMEQRVKRLRAAHLAAKQHNVSRLDRIIGASRRVFDAAHKITVMGLIGFSGVALLATAYAAGDMMLYNQKRRSQFLDLQKQMKEDSLESARLAYISGTASAEQIALVEEATAKAKQAGQSLPALLTPTPAAPAGGRPADTVPSTAVHPESSEPETKRGGITGWLFGGLKKEDTPLQPLVETLNTSDARTQTNTPAGAVSDAVFDKAKKAYEQEREAQRTGGPLDRVGVDATNTDPNPDAKKKKGWLW